MTGAVDDPLTLVDSVFLTVFWILVEAAFFGFRTWVIWTNVVVAALLRVCIVNQCQVRRRQSRRPINVGDETANECDVDINLRIKRLGFGGDPAAPCLVTKSSVGRDSSFR